ncbi:MAG TPA: hypothetical protein VGL97_09080 [Bryobacteraceae bacterium]|jgi:hypothetical protein
MLLKNSVHLGYATLFRKMTRLDRYKRLPDRRRTFIILSGTRRAVTEEFFNSIVRLRNGDHERNRSDFGFGGLQVKFAQNSPWVLRLAYGVAPIPLQDFGSLSRNITIVGVVCDFMNRGMALPPAPQIFTLFQQVPGLNFGFKDIVVRNRS